MIQSGLAAWIFEIVRTEIGSVEREEFGAEHFAAAVLDVFLDPVGGDLAVVVIGGQGVDLLAPIFQP